jgi:cysteine synthase
MNPNPAGGRCPGSQAANELVPLPHLGPDILTKIEFQYPSGSMKHRSIPAFVERLLDRGELVAGQPIAIRSAGAAAVTLAWAGARVGCPVIAVLPPSVAPAVVAALDWLGATCHVVDPAEATRLMGELAADGRTYVFAQANEERLIDHYRPVAADILGQLDQVAAITVGIGTGLSVTGIAREVRERSPSTQVWGVEPAEAAVASGNPWAPHHIPGLAPPIPQPLLATRLLAGIVPVPSEAAWSTARDVARRAGLLIGPSSGATVAAAVELRRRGVSGPIVAVSACAMNEYWDAVPMVPG